MSPNGRIEAVRTTPQIREEFQRKLFFDPSPIVKRVVFMATPHRGSSMARRLVGRVASKFVHYSANEEATYSQLMDCNRDIFFEYLWRAKPTAIDLLNPTTRCSMQWPKCLLAAACECIP